MDRTKALANAIRSRPGAVGFVAESELAELAGAGVASVLLVR